MPTKSPGAWIRERRKALDLTQDDLARRAGISVSYVSTLEREQKHSVTEAVLRPEPDKVKRIARALGADADELLVLYGYAPGNQITLKKPQTLEELIEALDALGIENIHFHEHDRLRTATPRQLQEVLDAVKLAVQLILARQENEGGDTGNSPATHGDEANPIRSD